MKDENNDKRDDKYVDLDVMNTPLEDPQHDHEPFFVEDYYLKSLDDRVYLNGVKIC